MVDSMAMAVIGNDESEPLFQIADALLLPDAVVVAERSTGTVRFYSFEGAFMRAVGGKGEGPGEFTSISWLQVIGSTLFAYDRSAFRLSEFDLQGNYLGSVRIEPVEPYATLSAFGVLSDGSIMATAQEFPSDTDQKGTMRRPVAVLRYDETGKFVDQIGSYQGSEVYVEPFGRAGQLTSRLTFGRLSAISVAENAIFVIENTDSRIVVLEADGTVARSIHPQIPARLAVEVNDIRIARARFISRQSPSGTSLDNLFDRMSVPDSFPFFGWEGGRRLSTLRTMRDGRLWSVLYGGIRQTNPTWVIVDPTGSRATTMVGSYSEIDVLDATADVVLVRTWDELDVERLEVRRLRSGVR